MIIVGIALLILYRANNSTEGEYSCHENIYNCSDFLSQREAQDVFNACGSGDIHNLDGDNEWDCLRGVIEIKYLNQLYSLFIPKNVALLLESKTSLILSVAEFS